MITFNRFRVGAQRGMRLGSASTEGKGKAERENRRLSLPAIFLLIFVISGCAAKVEYVPVYKTPECYIPSRPVYTPLDPEEHIGSHVNIERLMVTVSDMSAYIKRLESAVRCFRAGEERDGDY